MILFLNRPDPIIGFVIILMLAMPAYSLAQAGGAEPSLKQVLEEDVSKEEDAAQAADKKKPLVAPVDDLGRDTPRNSALGFLNATREGDYDRAAEYLDLGDLPKSQGIADKTELARRLKILLDSTFWVDLELLSDEPEGHADDGLPVHRDYVGSIKAEGQQVDILLQRVSHHGGPGIWMFSSATVRRIPELYAVHGYGPIGEKLSPASA